MCTQGVSGFCRGGGRQGGDEGQQFGSITSESEKMGKMLVIIFSLTDAQMSSCQDALKRCDIHVV